MGSRYDSSGLDCGLRSAVKRFRDQRQNEHWVGHSEGFTLCKLRLVFYGPLPATV